MKILNLGSLNIDKTYSVKRFVQPKETIQALDYEEFCGGKGLNQSVALARQARRYTMPEPWEGMEGFFWTC